MSAARNRSESIFWSLVTCLFISFGIYFCAIVLVELEGDPLELRIDTLNYNPAEVHFPALAFCPVQALDELNLAALLLDQVGIHNIPFWQKRKACSKSL